MPNRCRYLTPFFVLALAAAAPAAGAADASFDNSLVSPLLVSPAQIYQVNTLRTDLGVRYDSRDDVASYGTTGDTSQNSHTTDGALELVLPLPRNGLRFGLKLDHSLTVYGHLPSVIPLAETPAGSGVTSATGVLLAVDLGPLVLAVEGDYVVRSMTAPPGAKGPRDAFGIAHPGLLYQNGTLELGVTGQSASPARVGAVATGDQPEAVTVHGRYALDPSLVLGAVVSDALWSRINEALLDRRSVAATIEHNEGRTHLEGSLGYYAPYARDNAYSGTTVGALAFSLGEDYLIATNTKLGAAAGYETGSGRTPEYKVSTNVVTVQVRGDYRF